MKWFIQTMFLVPLILIGCESPNEIQPVEDDIVKGDVSFGLKDSVNFEQLLDTVFTVNEINQIKATVDMMSTEFPKDSLEYIKTVVFQYDFIDTAITLIRYDNTSNKWLLFLWIKAFSENNVPQWHILKNELKLSQTSIVTGLLKVEEEKESYCISRLRETGLFKWLEFNRIAHIAYKRNH